ncbi:hypothetical protein D3C86_1747400 [compost metagenome]
MRFPYCIRSLTITDLAYPIAVRMRINASPGCQNGIIRKRNSLWDTSGIEIYIPASTLRLVKNMGYFQGAGHDLSSVFRPNL